MDHKTKINELRQKVKIFYRKKKKFRIYHGSTNSIRLQNFKRDEVIDISALNQIISIDKKEKIAILEPNVSMDKLVKETLKFGLIPPVVPEFPSITVGGGIQGGSGESSGFKWGAFDNCFFEYEVVLGNGELITVSEKENRDLFHSLPSSFGSLGIITLAKLKLVPSKKYVKLSYFTTSSFEEIISLINKKSSEKIDYLDGIIFGKDFGVVIEGRLTDEKNFPLTRFSRPTDQWFYLHAKKQARGNRKTVEIVPMEDYLFRYDRGAFWTGEFVFERFGLASNRFSRFLLNPLLKTSSLYRFSQAFKTSQQSLIQDVCLPKDKVLEFLKYLDAKLRVYPLWICSGKSAEKQFLSPNFLDTDLVINIGVWKRLGKDLKSNIRLNRDLESNVKQLKGRKGLYAHCYYKRDEFWQIYDKSFYQKMRSKYSAEATLEDTYEKIIVLGSYKPSLSKVFFHC